MSESNLLKFPVDHQYSRKCEFPDCCDGDTSLEAFKSCTCCGLLPEVSYNNDNAFDDTSLTEKKELV